MDPQKFTLAGPLVYAIAAVGPGIGIGLIFAAYVSGVARQPEANNIWRPISFVAFALVELLARIGQLIACL